MARRLAEMTDAEFLGEVARVIEVLCKQLAESHTAIANALKAHDKSATAVLMHSAHVTLEGLGDICNSIDCVDDDIADDTGPVFKEMSRRYEIYVSSRKAPQ